MPKANTTFNLDVRDVELIENALNSIINKQSSTIINTAGNRNAKQQDNCPVEIKGQIAEMRDLLGRLHNQKIWYRPKNAVTYIGG